MAVHYVVHSVCNGVGGVVSGFVGTAMPVFRGYVACKYHISPDVLLYLQRQLSGKEVPAGTSERGQFGGVFSCGGTGRFLPDCGVHHGHGRVVVVDRSGKRENERERLKKHGLRIFYPDGEFCSGTSDLCRIDGTDQRLQNAALPVKSVGTTGRPQNLYGKTCEGDRFGRRFARIECIDGTLERWGCGGSFTDFHDFFDLDRHKNDVNIGLFANVWKFPTGIHVSEKNLQK